MKTQEHQPKLTFEQLPEAIAFLISEVAELKRLVQLQVVAEPEKRLPIGVYQASKILCKEIQTIYSLVRKKKIPFYKQGNQLYFFEDELLAYIEKGKGKK
jgi:excisionase family DNA binding protein